MLLFGRHFNNLNFRTNKNALKYTSHTCHEFVK